MATKADVQYAAETAASEAVDRVLTILEDLEHGCWRSDDAQGRAAILAAIALVEEAAA